MINFIKENLPNVYQLGLFGDQGWLTAIGQTLYMTFWGAIFGGFLGLVTGLILVITDTNGIKENKVVNFILDKIVSVFRALPFIILLVLVTPLTRSIFHVGIGVNAALVPLSLSVWPFYARQVQVALTETGNGKIEAALASGATFWDLIGLYLKESRSELIRVSTVSLISLVGLTAMAGAIGAGGIGTTAIVMGYQRYYNDVTLLATAIVLLIVLIIQFSGDKLAKHYNHK
ncbi:MAG: ABC transporter permease [Lactobacillaceae bacterium]|nr:ABC transporter permease [Lactobacillaceae bacterium]